MDMKFCSKLHETVAKKLCFICKMPFKRNDFTGCHTDAVVVCI